MGDTRCGPKETRKITRSLERFGLRQARSHLLDPNRFLYNEKRPYKPKNNVRQTPLDPGGPNCYQDETKPCESHGSKPRWDRGVRLSNMWLTYPPDQNNLGKLRLIPDRPRHLEWYSVKKAVQPCFAKPPEDGAATDQVVGEVTAHQAYNRYGP